MEVQLHNGLARKTAAVRKDQNQSLIKFDTIGTCQDAQRRPTWFRKIPAQVDTSLMRLRARYAHNRHARATLRGRKRINRIHEGVTFCFKT
jgi:hypothetical protein